MTTRRPAKDAVKAVRKRLGDALVVLESLGPLETRVHDARRDIRKARAALKLLRSSVSPKRRRALNAACRDASRVLSPTRDAQAIARAWKKLRLPIPAVSASLENESKRAARRFAGDAEALEQTRELLCRALAIAGGLAPRAGGWPGIAPGLRRGFRAARRARDVAVAEPADENFHEWRKRVKDQRYQLELFLDGSPALQNLVEKLRRLGETLGDEHDFAVLKDKLAGKAPAVAAIERRRAALRARALQQSRRVYDGDTRRFTRLVKRSWKAARDLKQ